MAVDRLLQALVIERLACESWIGQRSLSVIEPGRRVSLARNASSAEHSARMAEPVERGPSSTGTYPFLEAAFRAPLRASGIRNVLFVRSQRRRSPKPTRARSPTTRKPNVGRELYNGYAHNLQASPIEGSSRRYTSSPDSTSDSRGSSATGAGGRSQLDKRPVWFRGWLYGVGVAILRRDPPNQSRSTSKEIPSYAP